MNQQRRRLLQAAGATAVFGQLLTAQSVAHAQNQQQSLQSLRSRWAGRWPGTLSNRSVAILGGGISGLTVAYEMKRLGFSSTVIEARHRAGGRIETLRADDWIQDPEEVQHCGFSREPGFYFNTGPARISQGHTRVIRYCREMGVQLELVCNENKAAYFRVAALAHHGPMRLRRLQASLRGGIAEMLAKNVAAGNTGGFVRPSEIPALLSLLAQFGDLREDLSFTGSTRGGVVGGVNPMGGDKPFSPIEIRELMKMDFFSQYKLHLGEYLDQQASMLQPVNGMDHIIRAMQAQVADRVLLGAVVTAVERQGHGAIVHYNRHGQKMSQFFDRVVVALPPLLAARVGRGFSSPVKAALKSHQMAKPAKVAFQSERFWETKDGIYGGISYTDDEITMLWYPSHGFGERQGVIVGAYNIGVFPGEKFADRPWQERIKLAVEQGERIHPGYTQKIHSGISRSWVKTAYSEGGWSLTAPADVLKVPDGPFLFAGDYLSHMSGWMEGAVASAHAALNQL